MPLNILFKTTCFSFNSQLKELSLVQLRLVPTSDVYGQYDFKALGLSALLPALQLYSILCISRPPVVASTTFSCILFFFVMLRNMANFQTFDVMVRLSRLLCNGYHLQDSYVSKQCKWGVLQSKLQRKMSEIRHEALKGLN